MHMRTQDAAWRCLVCAGVVLAKIVVSHGKDVATWEISKTGADHHVFADASNNKFRRPSMMRRESRSLELREMLIGPRGHQTGLSRREYELKHLDMRPSRHVRPGNGKAHSKTKPRHRHKKASQKKTLSGELLLMVPDAQAVVANSQASGTIRDLLAGIGKVKPIEVHVALTVTNASALKKDALFRRHSSTNGETLTESTLNCTFSIHSSNATVINKRFNDFSQAQLATDLQSEFDKAGLDKEVAVGLFETNVEPKRKKKSRAEELEPEEVVTESMLHIPEAEADDEFEEYKVGPNETVEVQGKIEMKSNNVDLFMTEAKAQLAVQMAISHVAHLSVESIVIKFSRLPVEPPIAAGVNESVSKDNTGATAEAPKAAEGPEAAKVSEAAEAPEASKDDTSATAEGPEAAEGKKEAETPEASKDKNTGATAEAPEATEGPKDAETPEASKDHNTGATAEAPKATEGPEAAKGPEAEEAPEAADGMFVQSKHHYDGGMSKHKGAVKPEHIADGSVGSKPTESMDDMLVVWDARVPGRKLETLIHDMDSVSNEKFVLQIRSAIKLMKFEKKTDVPIIVIKSMTCQRHELTPRLNDRSNSTTEAVAEAGSKGAAEGPGAADM